VIRQLEGYELPAAAWETTVLPGRVAGYRKEYLDQLCYSGDVMWGRLSAHPAFADTIADNPRRIRPTKLAPIALFAREHAGELIVRGDN
jgi:ATP-dependent Lhr-like helicase